MREEGKKVGRETRQMLQKCKGVRFVKSIGDQKEKQEGSDKTRFFEAVIFVQLRSKPWDI